MTSVPKLLTALLDEQLGVTAIEYALLATLIAIAIIVGAIATGDSLLALFTDIANKVVTVVSGA